MDYLKKYGITQEEITELKEIYNENIIKFIKENEIFITEKLEYLKNENYIIYPILRNNIRIFLEIIQELERKIAIMDEYKIRNSFDLLDIIYKIDLVFISKNTRREFLEEIKKEGVDLWKDLKKENNI